MNLFEARDLVCELGRRLWQRGYVSANDGNLSVKIDDDTILATPTGVSKGFMNPEDLVVTDMRGEVLQGRLKPSSELRMHIKVYELRADIQAVVHAHPPYATAFALAGIALDKCLLPESILSLGAVPIVPYGTPSTDEIPMKMSEYIPTCDAVLLANHGAVVWADSLLGAYYRMESLEHSATIIHHALALGEPRALDESQVQQLAEVRKNMAISGKALSCDVVRKPSEGEPVVSLGPSGGDRDELVDRIAGEVMKVLNQRK